MKHTIKAILLFFTAALLISSCSSDDPNPPSAGFTLDPSDVVQWDTSLVVDTSTGSDAAATSYTVTGGEFIYLGNTIQFLEAKTYTIKQTVENEDGIDTSVQTVVVGTPDNFYALDGTQVPMTTNAFWYLPPWPPGASKYIRMLIPISGQDNPNLIKLYPVAGPNPLQGTYTWGADGDVGTYDAAFTQDYAGFSYGWTTNGDDGADMEIKLIYTDPLDDDNNIYEIMLTSYTLNYGDWNFATEEWMSEGTKELVIYYRGKIDPIDE